MGLPGALAAAAARLPGLSLVPPPVLPGASLEPLVFPDLDGWRADDHRAAFATFLASCAALRAPPREVGPIDAPTLREGLRQACANATRLGTAEPSDLVARLFFEVNFAPWRVVPDKGGAGFFTGYYEPEVAGALTPGGGFDVPVYRRPDDLVMSGGGPTPNSGPVQRRDADGRMVPYFDRAAIEDGALAGRGLEVAWLKDPIDLFFMQIQGSARVRLPDGRVLRLNYDGYNGHPYLPVARLLIQRGLVPREEMSMARIRAFMEQDPQAGRALRRENRSYVFFKALDLGAGDGAMGAQGVSLTAGRSMAVDRRIHTYGVPVFVEADLPLSAPGAADPFRRLMIAQDTGSAIVGPARADLYFGAGDEAGAVAGRIRHPGRFILLVPRLARIAPGAP
ncbi:MltA domain-containing protein [Xanthobacter autotrophicus DSM 431]|uniref:murein transglycosylase A n=1 Tax=Xanthobacter nonsaccharivorans TaxID=3119912 RepID=UPI003726CE27